MIRTTPYPLIDPNLLLAALPGPPTRALPGAEPAPDHEALGYVLAGDLFLAAVMTRLRSTPPRDEYDSDLSVAVKVAPTERRATTLFRAECRQDEAFLVRASASPIALNPALEAAEAFAWTSPGPVPRIVVLARYGNYIIRCVGCICADGPFTSQSHFLAAVRETDRHAWRVLNGVT